MKILNKVRRISRNILYLEAGGDVRGARHSLEVKVKTFKRSQN